MIAKKHLKSGVVLLIGLAAAALAFAQSPVANFSQAALPDGPLLKAAPEFSRWTIDFSYPQDRQETGKGSTVPVDPSLPRKIVITKTRQILHEETTTVNGKKLDSWQQNEDYYTKPPGRNSWAAYEKPTQAQVDSGTAVIMAIPKNGFRDLEWIGVKTFVGLMKSKDSSYLVFVPDAPNLDVNDTKILQAQTTIAYVDGDSRLPVRVTERNISRTYKFEEISEVMQKLPDDLLAEIKQGDEIRAKFNAAPLKEY